MIPLRDNTTARRLTPINTILIAANLLLFLLELRIASRADALLAGLALVPANLSAPSFPNLNSLWPPLTLLTSLFLHGSILHLLGNMLYLFIFGAAVEGRMGAARYLSFYLLAGVAAGLATVWMDPASRIPVIGASGAIAGVLGAYFFFNPRARITLFVFIDTIRVPAMVFLLIWFAAQLYFGLMPQPAGAALNGVAWWAHVGGFLFGVAAGPLLARSRPRRRAAIRYS